MRLDFLLVAGHNEDMDTSIDKMRDEVTHNISNKMNTIKHGTSTPTQDKKKSVKQLVAA